MELTNNDSNTVEHWPRGLKYGILSALTVQFEYIDRFDPRLAKHLFEGHRPYFASRPAGHDPSDRGLTGRLQHRVTRLSSDGSLDDSDSLIEPIGRDICAKTFACVR